jgi:hypothetical protein
MRVDYNILPDDTKVFVYPASRKFYPQEIDSLHKEIDSFSEENFGDYPMHYKVLYNRFIIFFIESKNALPTQLLDKLANFILELEKKYNITLLDKINICFKQGEYIQYQDMKRFRELIKNKSISKKTIVFNNLAQNKYDFETNFEIPISDSWLSHLIK